MKIYIVVSNPSGATSIIESVHDSYELAEQAKSFHALNSKILSARYSIVERVLNQTWRD